MIVGEQLLTTNNFLLYAAQHYNNPSCRDIDEFAEDLRRIKYTKKLITRAIESGDLKTRLILNHIIVLNNVFEPMVLCRIMYLKMQEYMPYLKPFFIYLNIYQPKIYNVKKEGVIDLDNIPMDERIIEDLRKF